MNYFLNILLMYNLIYTKKVNKDLENIRDYITFDKNNIIILAVYKYKNSWN